MHVHGNVSEKSLAEIFLVLIVPTVNNSLTQKLRRPNTVSIQSSSVYFLSVNQKMGFI